MIAVSFFDALAREDAPGGEPNRFDEIATLASSYVDSALADWRHVLDCERRFGSTRFPSPAEQSRVNRSLCEVYQKWAEDTEQVLLRTRQLADKGRPVENAELLEEAFGRVQARLKMTPEMFDRAREQARRGEFIPTRELRARLRA